MAFDLKSYAREVRVLDGAWGTELQKHGLPAGSAPELWNSANPQAVAAVARGYVQAGSDIILTNTFGANRIALASAGPANPAAELAEKGAAISRRAAGESVKVFGSIGPTGKIVMMGEVDEEEIAGAFEEAAAALARGGVDAIVLETFNELAEIEIALRAVKRACELPVVACMTFASGPERTATMMGNTPGDLAALAKAGRADAVGANCGVGPENYVRVAELLAQATELPIWIKPNAGMPQVTPGGQTVFPMGADEFATHVPKLISAGARFVGGCCGTTPEHIRAVRAAVEAAKPS